MNFWPNFSDFGNFILWYFWMNALPFFIFSAGVVSLWFLFLVSAAFWPSFCGASSARCCRRRWHSVITVTGSQDTTLHSLERGKFQPSPFNSTEACFGRLVLGFRGVSGMCRGRCAQTALPCQRASLPKDKDPHWHQRKGGKGGHVKWFTRAIYCSYYMCVVCELLAHIFRWR